ncbi:MAG: pyridoxamine 5'-phosphate oxidase [Bacteroidia bacterium]
MQELRKNYSKNQLLEDYLSDDPITQFNHWFEQAIDEGVMEPNAMILSSRTEDGVDSRTVLLKGIEEGDFVFYTNFQSHKAQQLLKDPHCTLLFLWLQEERQIIVRGKASEQSLEKSESYFRSRPRGSQIGAWASVQSATVESREVLEDKLDQLTKKFEGKDVPRPEHWGGFRVSPYQIEFWQGRPNRLHDRILYEYENDSWSWKRLQP